LVDVVVGDEDGDEDEDDSSGDIQSGKLQPVESESAIAVDEREAPSVSLHEGSPCIARSGK
jgi:hypothetical protein